MTQDLDRIAKIEAELIDEHSIIRKCQFVPELGKEHCYKRPLHENAGLLEIQLLLPGIHPNIYQKLYPFHATYYSSSSP